jgi:4-carboxymuconolactone decarboxylase
MNELTKKGLETYTSIRGKERAKTWEDRIEKGGFGSAMTELSAQYAFGSVWARDGLARRDKSLVTIGILLALRQTEELKHHISIGITHGLTIKEIEEIFIHATVYAGFPAADVAMQAAQEVFKELGLN